MKSILVIGLGRFGKYLSLKFAELGNEVMVVDKNEQRVDDIAPHVSDAQIGDCTSEDVLKSIGVNNFDMVFVCIGQDFQANLIITSLVKELGAKHVISKSNEQMYEKFLLKMGADEVIYPEKTYAEKTAVRYSAEHVFDILELSEDYYICEIPTNRDWVGETISSINFRVKYKINILATKVGDKMKPMPGADHVFTEDEHLIVLGEKKDISKLLKQL